MKADEPQVGQRHEDVERKHENYHVIIFPEISSNFKSRKEWTNEYHNDGTFQHMLFHNSGPANQQHTYQSIIQSGNVKGYLHQHFHVFKLH